MTRNACIAAVLVATASFAGVGPKSTGPKGTVPKASAALYAAHAEREGTAIGATVIPSREAQKAFSTPISRCCTVVEVAFYPSKDQPQEISLNDFVLRVEGTDNAVKPSSAKVTAATLQKKAASDRDLRISPGVGVGYNTGGYDPVSGRHGGFDQSVGVGVSTGGAGPKPGSTEGDRNAMELELNEKGLPEGTAPAPVSGYLYFQIRNTQKAHHVLEYTMNGKKMVVTLN